MPGASRTYGASVRRLNRRRTGAGVASRADVAAGAAVVMGAWARRSEPEDLVEGLAPLLLLVGGDRPELLQAAQGLVGREDQRIVGDVLVDLQHLVLGALDRADVV